MASFFGKLRSTAGTVAPTGGIGSIKRDPLAPGQTPLEKLLENAGPIKSDGSDKFYGMENFGTTCYCNSVIQCLYYSVAFREHILNFPIRSPAETVRDALDDAARKNAASAPTANGAATSSSPLKTALANNPISPARKTLPAASPGQAPRPEEKPDAPEYKKRHAMMAGPVLSMDYENAKNHGVPESLFASLKDIFEAIVAHQSRTGVISPLKFLENLKRDYEMFRSSAHQDAHEFFNLLLNDVMESVGKANKSVDETLAKVHSEVPASLVPNGQATAGGRSWVHELFEGTLTSETRCLTCENVSQRDEPFLDLSVDLDEHSSVTSCLRKFSEEEMLCERNKFHCDVCNGLQEAEKRMKIKRLPRILALHLKRFQYTEDLQRLQKLFHRVVYPYHLRLFNTTDDAENSDRLYELYAVVVHIGGGPYHGHYVSIIKTEGRGWLLFDDEMVEPVDKSFVQNFFGDRPGLACAYVLFYQETTLEAVQREQEAEGMMRNSEAVSAKEWNGAKANGHAANGHAHPVTAAWTPPMEDSATFASLDHAATAPPAAVAGPVPGDNSGSPTLTAKLGSTRSEVRSKKERAEEEKRAKQAEKQKAKEGETRRKEVEKKAKEDGKPRKSEDENGSGKDATEVHKENGSATGGMMAGSLNRFRQTSKSMSRKPKFWGSKDREEMPRRSHELLRDVSKMENGSTQDREADADVPDLPLLPVRATDKADKPKGHRFSLKKKTSAMFT
ncbi:MAG: hypothetical protein M1825_002905 [Sarcosagium campestre]|nr:MAG: hypothetical protein M1825_002905 [Sarcosagium campestre]